MTDYKYISLLDNGYKQIYLTKKQHNSIFCHRKIRWNDKYEYYINNDNVIIHRYVNVIGIFVMVLSFPM